MGHPVLLHISWICRLLWIAIIDSSIYPLKTQSISNWTGRILSQFQEVLNENLRGEIGSIHKSKEWIQGYSGLCALCEDYPVICHWKTKQKHLYFISVEQISPFILHAKTSDLL